MSTGSRPPKRPVVGSRNPTGRPRKVAGRREPAAPAAAPEAEEAPEVPDEDEEPPPPQPTEPPPEERSGRFDSPLFTSRRTTVVLSAALVALVALLAGLAWYVWAPGEPVVSSDRPVVTGEIASKSAVDAAAQSTEEILSYGYNDFDAQIAEATSKMTDTFAERYQETAAGVRQEFIEKKTEQQVKVVGQSVVQASSEKVQALLFIDQYVVRDGQSTNVTPYRALVTMVHTDSGWLVDSIKTQ